MKGEEDTKSNGLIHVDNFIFLNRLKIEDVTEVENGDNVVKIGGSEDSVSQNSILIKKSTEKIVNGHVGKFLDQTSESKLSVKLDNAVG